MSLSNILKNIGSFFILSTPCLDAELELLLQNPKIAKDIDTKIESEKYFQNNQVKSTEDEIRYELLQVSGLKRYSKF